MITIKILTTIIDVSVRTFVQTTQAGNPKDTLAFRRLFGHFVACWALRSAIGSQDILVPVTGGRAGGRG